MMQNVIGFSRALSVKAVLAGRKSSTIYVATALFFLLQLVLPLVVDEWTLRIILFANIFVIYAASYDLLAGYTGLVSFGHSLFFGGAGYVSGLLSLNLGLPLLACVIAALIAPWGISRSASRDHILRSSLWCFR